MFDRFQKLNVKGKTAKFTVYALNEDPKPVLILKPAGMENPDWLNAMLRSFGSQQQINRLKNASVENIERSRAAVREHYPSTVVVGWSGMRDDKGIEVNFSLEACRELFRMLPDYLIDDIRTFAEIPENFLDIAPVNVEAVAGN